MNINNNTLLNIYQAILVQLTDLNDLSHWLCRVSFSTSTKLRKKNDSELFGDIGLEC